VLNFVIATKFQQHPFKINYPDPNYEEAAALSAAFDLHRIFIINSMIKRLSFMAIVASHAKWTQNEPYN
jgi:hypothetical protein